MNRLKIFVFVLFCTAWSNAAWAQTFCLALTNPTVSGNQFQITITMYSSSPFGLGSSNFVFSYNTAGFTNGPIPLLTHPTLVSGSSPLTIALGYTMPSNLVTAPLDGWASYNIEYNGADGAGVIIPTTGIAIGTIAFTIENSALTSDLEWLYNGGTTQTVVYDDDNATQLFATSNTSTCLANSSTPLPLELLSFNAKAVGTQVNLDWATANERLVAGFDVERSADGHRFTPVGYVAAKNNTRQSYTFTDQNPLSGTSYYRLKMMDSDRTFKYSAIEKVSFGKIREVTIFPNPVAENGTLNIRVSNEKEAIQGSLFDNTGRKVRSFTFTQEGVFEVKGLPSGIYQYMLETGDWMTFGKIVVE